MLGLTRIIEDVVATPTNTHVGTRIAIQRIVAAAAQDAVVPALPANRIRARAAQDEVVAGGAADHAGGSYQVGQVNGIALRWFQIIHRDRTADLGEGIWPVDG